jgi:urea transport system ATP-binding protein
MQTNTTPAETILSVQNLTVSFDGFRALDGLDFAMADGELRFVIGPNGAGKTTLLDVVTGKTRPQQGAVTFKFQTPTIFGSLTVFENLEAAAGFNDGIVRVFGRLSADDRSKIEQTLELIGLHQRAHVRAGILAHGEKQWLEIGMLLVQEPRLLLLDEPVAGMTRQERNRTGELLQAIAQRCSVLVVEHDMEFMRSFATTVSVLHMGKLLCQGSVQAVQNDPRVIEVYLGRSHHQH